MIRIVWSIYKKAEKVLIQLHSSIVSVLSNTNEKIQIHILCDEKLTTDDRMDLKKLVETEYNQEVFFHDIVFDFSKVNFPMSHTKGAYYRLFLSDYIGQDGKVIYLDYDLYVHMDIKELWDVELGDKSIAVVIDSLALTPTKEIIAYFEKREIDIKEYCNTGVMLIDMGKWNSKGIIDSAIEYFKRYPYCRFVDQDFLNYYFEGEKLFIPTMYNIMDMHSKKENENEKPYGIYHFCGIPKPWDVYRGGLDKMYWLYLSKTKYGYNGADLINYIPITEWPVDRCVESGMPLGSRKKLLVAIIKDVIVAIKKKISHQVFNKR